MDSVEIKKLKLMAWLVIVVDNGHANFLWSANMPRTQEINEIPASKGKKLLKIQKLIFIFDLKSPFAILLCQCNKKHPFFRMQTVP